MAKVLKEYERQIEDFRLVPSGEGRFELMVNDELLFSKKAAGRHANENEILELLGDYLEKHPG